MSYGMAAQDTNLELTMHTDYVNGIFFKNTGTYSTTATIPTQNFLTSFAVSTPLSPTTVRDLNTTRYGSYNGTGGVSVRDIAVTCAGATNSAGTGYYQPTANIIANSSPSFYPYTYVTANSSFVHTFGTLSSVSGYGFACKGPVSLAISQDSRSYCLHPASGNTKLRYGTATSVAASGWLGAGQNINFVQPTTPNVFFDKPYDKPPLIFITQSSGPIALSYINRDANGKYVSAAIVAAKTLGTYNGATSFITSNTYSFTYFIVSDETPVYATPATYGVRAFDSSGNKIYDSTNFMPLFLSATVNTPHIRIDTDYYYRSYNTATFNKSSSLGVCINNVNPFTGQCEYGSGNYGFILAGPFSFVGRYISVTSTTVTFSGQGTTSSDRIGMTGALSYDYTLNTVPTSTLLFGSYLI